MITAGLHLLTLSMSTSVTTAWCPPPNQVPETTTRIHHHTRNSIHSMKIRNYKSFGPANTSTSIITSTSSTCLSEAYYTKGAEIFPECNKREFTLADSFPNGIIPPMAQDILKDEAPDVLKRLLDEEGLQKGSSSSSDSGSDSSRRNIILLLASSAVIAGTASSQYMLNSMGE